MYKLLRLLLSLSMLGMLCIAFHGCKSEEKTMVYVSGQEREAIYHATTLESFDSRGEYAKTNTKIVKDSITKLYTMDMLEFAQTNDVELFPWMQGDSTVYMAKTITDNNEYGGNVMFSYNDGVARYMDHIPNATSCSYADHAERIRLLLEKKEFVSVYDVKLVYIDFELFFYVESENVFIPLGYERYDPQRETDVVCTQEDIKKNADYLLEKHIEFLQRKAAFEKEHPGETYKELGTPSAPKLYGNVSRVDNVLNIFEYLGLGS